MEFYILNGDGHLSSHWNWPLFWEEEEEEAENGVIVNEEVFKLGDNGVKRAEVFDAVLTAIKLFLLGENSL